MKRRASGLSLIELMLALLLGALVVVTAIGVFVGNRQTMARAQDLGQIQQSMQAALALLTHAVRQAGGTPCSRHLPLANAIQAPASRWWTRLISIQVTAETWNAPWGTSVRGLSAAEFAPGTGSGARVMGSDAIELLLAGAHTATAVSHDGAQFELNSASHGFSSGNFLLACDPRQASLFQAQVAGTTITHPAGGLNCSGNLGLPGGCDAPPFLHAAHTLIARWDPQRWYLGHNGRGGTSLYQTTLNGNGQGVIQQEMVANVSALEFRYWLAGASTPLPLPAVNGQWDKVLAVHITLTITAADRKTDHLDGLKRTATHTVSLRNRNP